MANQKVLTIPYSGKFTCEQSNIYPCPENRHVLDGLVEVPQGINDTIVYSLYINQPTTLFQKFTAIPSINRGMQL